MMTNEMRDTITTIMNSVCGGDWFDTDMTDEMLDTCCAQCPYRDRCHTDNLFYGCAVWEEGMGEDL